MQRVCVLFCPLKSSKTAKMRRRYKSGDGGQVGRGTVSTSCPTLRQLAESARKYPNPNPESSTSSQQREQKSIMYDCDQIRKSVSKRYVKLVKLMLVWEERVRYELIHRIGQKWKCEDHSGVCGRLICRCLDKLMCIARFSDMFCIDGA